MPSCAPILANSRPKPPAPPVMTATLSLKFFKTLLLKCGGFSSRLLKLLPRRLGEPPQDEVLPHKAAKPHPLLGSQSGAVV